MILRGSGSREFLFGILRKHCNKYIITYFNFSLIRRGYLNEDISSVKTNFRVIPVNNRRQRTNSSLRVHYNRVYRRISDYRQIAREVFVVLFIG